MNMHDHLSTLDESKTGWTLKVRVTRLWDTISNTGVVIVHNLILLDCLNTDIHATVTPELWINYQNAIIEGGLYQIQNVRVRQATGLYRPVSNVKCIVLVPSTIISPYIHDDFIIPMHKFDLKPLGCLFENVYGYEPYHKPIYSTDVIGVLEDLQPLQTIHTHYGEREIVRFRITDGSVSIKVSFWGPLNENTALLYGNHVEAPVIVILANIRISTSKGNVLISNLPSSKIFINLPYPDVLNLRNRLAATELPPHFEDV